MEDWDVNQHVDTHFRGFGLTKVHWSGRGGSIRFVWLVMESADCLGQT